MTAEAERAIEALRAIDDRDQRSRKASRALTGLMKRAPIPVDAALAHLELLAALARDFSDDGKRRKARRVRARCARDLEALGGAPLTARQRARRLVTLARLTHVSRSVAELSRVLAASREPTLELTPAEAAVLDGLAACCAWEAGEREVAVDAMLLAFPRLLGGDEPDRWLEDAAWQAGQLSRWGGELGREDQEAQWRLVAVALLTRCIERRPRLRAELGRHEEQLGLSLLREGRTTEALQTLRSAREHLADVEPARRRVEAQLDRVGKG